MGKILLIMVILVTVIFATITITMRQSTSQYVDSIVSNLDDLRAKEISNFALDYAIRQIDLGNVSKSSIPFISNGYYNLNVSNFDVLSATIDSIKYSCIDINTADTQRDTILIRVHVTHGNRSWASEAIIGAAGGGGFASGKGFWDMEAGSGTAVNDNSGNGYNGQLVNANTSTAWATGKNGYGINLDGTNDRIDIDPGFASTYDDQMTVAAWVKLDHSFLDWGIIAAEQTQASGWPVVWTLRSRLIDLWIYKEVKFAFNVQTASTIEEVSITKNGWQMDTYAWHYVVGSYDGTYSNTQAEIKIHILDEGFSNSKIIPKWSGRAGTNDVSIGGRQTNHWFFGLFACLDATLDEVRILDGVYDVTELADFQNNLLPPTADKILRIKEFTN